MRKIYRKMTKGAVLILCISMLLCGCSDTQNDTVNGDSRITVDVMKVQKGTLVLNNRFVGSVTPKEAVYIIPLAQGSVTHTYFNVGDTVQAGDVLFEIDDTAAQMQLKQAQLTYNNTKAQLDSSWNSASTQKESALDQLETQRISTLAQLQAAQIQYFGLKDSVEQGIAALDAMKKQYTNIDNMTADEILLLAEQMANTMISSSTGVDIGAILDKITGENENIGGQISDEDKEKLANELRPRLKELLGSQIKETETAMKQAEMSLNAAETGMQAAQEGYDLILESIETAKNTDLNSTREQLDNSLKLAELGVNSAKLALSYYDVTTPISGTVISKAVEVNGFATSSQPSYIIVNDDTMSVTFFVSESVKNTLQSGAEISVERNGAVFEGVITEIGNAVNQQTGLFQVKAMVYADGNQLPSGVSVKITAETYKAENAVTIPYDAVYYESAGAYVYVVKDGTAKKTMVTTGLFDEENIEITSGLQVEDVVIISWSPRLLDGAKVQASSESKAN